MNDEVGILSHEEKMMLTPRVYAADLISFLDSQRVTIGPPIRPDGSGWLICFDADAFTVSAWGPTADGQRERLNRRCSTLTEAIDVVRRYEMMLPMVGFK
jgi:hypothetical protein